MTRYVLIRVEGEEKVVPETRLPLEADLHDALTKHPELLPAGDMGLGRTVVVGRESAFASGYADLILVDDRGQVCLVEVKKEGNPDTRQVVAQLLDYAGALWGKTLLEFEQDVLAPYLRAVHSESSVTLREFLSETFGPQEEAAAGESDLSPATEEIEASLAETLRSGRFVLVVAAPVIPEGVRRVLDYMNSQSFRLFGLEVSYFNDPMECFVPRLSVQPPSQEHVATHPRRIWDEESIMQQMRLRNGDQVADVAARILDWAEARGLRRWYGTGQMDGSCYLGKEDPNGYLRPFALWTSGVIQVQFGEMASGKHPSFEPVEMRRELQRRLNEITDISITENKIDKGVPTFKLAVLSSAESEQRFLEVMDWALGEVG